jgi:uncharacterized lipoprotein YajG
MKWLIIIVIIFMLNGCATTNEVLDAVRQSTDDYSDTDYNIKRI